MLKNHYIVLYVIFMTVENIKVKKDVFKKGITIIIFTTKYLKVKTYEKLLTCLENLKKFNKIWIIKI